MSIMVFPGAQTVKALPAMLETQVRSLGWEDPLEKGKATHSSILAWKIPWREVFGRLPSMGSQRVRCDLATKHARMEATWGFPRGSVLKNLPANAGDTGDIDLIPDLGRSLEQGKATHSSLLAW